MTLLDWPKTKNAKLLFFIDSNIPQIPAAAIP